MRFLRLTVPVLLVLGAACTGPSQSDQPPPTGDAAMKDLSLLNKPVRERLPLPEASLPIQDVINFQQRQTRLLPPPIVGGDPVDAGEFPWQVSLFVSAYTPRNGHFCGGSVIAPSWIVTAAHCVENRTDPSLISALLGTQVLSAGGERHAIDRIIIHAGWNPRTRDNDVALLRMTTPTAITPVALIAADPTDVAVVSGCGVTREGGEVSDQLRKVRVPIVTRADCNRPQSYGGSITENMICAGVKDKDSCQGDSGGPLMAPLATPALAGLVSWGEGCAEKDKPGVYTRITNYATWIHDHMQ